MQKIVILGEPAVGKSSLLLRYADNVFKENFVPTIGLDFRVKEVDIDGQKLKLQIWDTAGQECYRIITSSYYKGASAIFLLYDITSIQSFNKIREWIDQADANAQQEHIKVLIGNKYDLEEKRQVPTQAAQTFADQLNLIFYETSAKTGYNINEVFQDLGKKLIKNPEMRETILIQSVVKVEKPRKCCKQFKWLIQKMGNQAIVSPINNKNIKLNGFTRPFHSQQIFS